MAGPACLALDAAVGCLPRGRAGQWHHLAESDHARLAQRWKRHGGVMEMSWRCHHGMLSHCDLGDLLETHMSHRYLGISWSFEHGWWSAWISEWEMQLIADGWRMCFSFLVWMLYTTFYILGGVIIRYGKYFWEFSNTDGLTLLIWENIMVHVFMTRDLERIFGLWLLSDDLTVGYRKP